MRLREHAAIQPGALDIFRADPRHLIEQEGYNVRDLTTPEAQEKLRELADSIAEIGVTDPLVVRFDGERIIVVEGHRRLIATLMAIEAGAEIKSVPIYQEARGVNDAQRDLGLIVSNSGEPLTALEKAKVIGRLVAHGWSHPEIAKKCGWKSVASVLQYLDMLAMPEAVKQQVRDKVVSVTTARQVVKETAKDAKNDPEFAAELIRKNKEENAKIRGKDKSHKVTAKTLKRDKPKPEPKAKSDLAPLGPHTTEEGQRKWRASATPEVITPTAFGETKTIETFSLAPPATAQEASEITRRTLSTAQRHGIKDLLAALKPFADLCNDFDPNEKADDDIVEVFVRDVKRAWEVYTAAMGGQEEEAA